MTHDFYIVDAFTSKPFKGNPAGVVMLERFPDDDAMQLIALQMYLSETAFLVKEGMHHYSLRWFTPEAEVNLCGHATLACMHVLRQTGEIGKGDIVTFKTLSGDLHAQALGNEAKDAIELDFPTLAGTNATPHTALKYLETPFSECQRNRDNFLVEVKDYETLVACKPWFKKLVKMDAQGVIVTTNKHVPPGFDFASRYFAPGLGIDEDPVTGSAHCFLAPYWAKKLGKTKFRALQASRGEGILDVTLRGERTLIAGTCVTTLKGQMEIPKTKKLKGLPA